MTKMIFVNLPAADPAVSKRFYKAIGFQEDRTFGDNGGRSAMMRWSDAICVNLLRHDFYATFTSKQIVDAHSLSEVLICLSVESKEATAALINAAVAAGGREVRERQDLPFMYGGAIEDLDGHIIEPMWMDVDAMLAMQQQQPQAA